MAIQNTVTVVDPYTKEKRVVVLDPRFNQNVSVVNQTPIGPQRPIGPIAPTATQKTTQPVTNAETAGATYRPANTVTYRTDDGGFETRSSTPSALDDFKKRQSFMEFVKMAIQKRQGIRRSQVQCTWWCWLHAPNAPEKMKKAKQQISNFKFLLLKKRDK